MKIYVDGDAIRVICCCKTAKLRITENKVHREMFAETAKVFYVLAMYLEYHPAMFKCPDCGSQFELERLVEFQLTEDFVLESSNKGIALDWEVIPPMQKKIS